MAAPECLGLCCWFICSHKKAESPIHFGPTDSSGQATRLSLNFTDYFAKAVLRTPRLKTQANLHDSHLQVPYLEFKDPWLSVPPSRMVWPFGLIYGSRDRITQGGAPDGVGL